MTGRIEFTNVKREEKELTRRFLDAHGAYDVVEDSDPEGNPHFSFSIAVDTPEDVRNALAIMLFYNNYAPEAADREVARVCRYEDAARPIETEASLHIWREISNGRGNHGSFLRSFAATFANADDSNVILLLPASSKLVEKYNLYRYLDNWKETA